MSIKAAAGETDFTLLRCSAPANVSDKVYLASVTMSKNSYERLLMDMFHLYLAGLFPFFALGVCCLGPNGGRTVPMSNGSGLECKLAYSPVVRDHSERGYLIIYAEPQRYMTRILNAASMACARSKAQRSSALFPYYVSTSVWQEFSALWRR